jgi:hypothetical protein
VATSHPAPPGPWRMVDALVEPIRTRDPPRVRLVLSGDQSGTCNKVRIAPAESSLSMGPQGARVSGPPKPPVWQEPCVSDPLPRRVSRPGYFFRTLRRATPRSPRTRTREHLNWRAPVRAGRTCSTCMGFCTHVRHAPLCRREPRRGGYRDVCSIARSLRGPLTRVRYPAEDHPSSARRGTD